MHDSVIHIMHKYILRYFMQVIVVDLHFASQCESYCLVNMMELVEDNCSDSSSHNHKWLSDAKISERTHIRQNTGAKIIQNNKWFDKVWNQNKNFLVVHPCLLP